MRSRSDEGSRTSWYAHMAPSLDLFGLSGWEGCKSRTLRRPDQVKKLMTTGGMKVFLVGLESWPCLADGEKVLTSLRTYGRLARRLQTFSLVQNLWKCPAGQAVADSTMLGRQAAPRFALLHQE